MRTLATLVCACLALLAPRDIPAQDTGGEPTPAAGATNAAEEASASAARATSDEPGLLESGGPIDLVFGDLLEAVAFVPFYNLLGSGETPPFPWKAADGTVIPGQATYDEFRTDYVRMLAGEVPARFPRPWTDANGETIQLDVEANLARPALPFVVVWLVIGAVFFTLSWRFVNVRMFGHAIQVVRGRYDNPDDHGEVSHFQALASALSATVGLGNIAGVAIAISIGGPGATFWMIVAGLFGMSLKFTECTLGQKFRKIDEQGNVSGGPMRYLRDGLANSPFAPLGTVLALLFTVFCIGGSLAGGNSFQVNQSLGILSTQVDFFDQHGWVYGVVMAVLVGIVIIGGIRRIAQVAEKIVPTMCGLYVVSALIVILGNAGQVPDAFGQIFGQAFAADAIYGGAIGTLIQGFRRAAFSNEAGVGSAAIAHSAARTEYPVREGIVALLEPFIDTVVVCTMTALVIVITGVYAPDGGQAALVAGKDGAALTKSAFESIGWMRSWFPWVLTIAVVLFAFSTMISWSYYGERCWTTLFGPRSSLAYKILFLVFVVLGSIVSAGNVLEFGDLMILIMAFPNILGLYLLRGVVARELREYETKLRSGEMQTYDG